ncbi:Abi family protein [Pseudoglutamicibacter cumminsii]|uniref:CAAX protease n=1 Tax=Pseudoglutamicibacter cumminsii TaxID=156979 RepID=A0ABX5L508_9MICC|nr:Abi family protein [Pseudoglutamicibacter cumminsii]PWI27194.1 CAAX protease [Pseudoglutamicibacter cumminsii]
MKHFKTVSELVNVLQARGMHIADTNMAEQHLSRISYYRLSGYWYPMRRRTPDKRMPLDDFIDEASFDLVLDLYRFDERLRRAVFTELDRLELAVRAMLGHELGAIDPLIYLKPEKLGARAAQRDKQGRVVYSVWISRFERELAKSKEDFVHHHRAKYGGQLPVWAAVEIMDWGMASHLFGMAPNRARAAIAAGCGLNAAQLESWLKSLNILRNLAAHHARMYNRTFDIKPKLNNHPTMQAVRSVVNRLFGQLTMVQYLNRELGLSEGSRLPRLLNTYPHNDVVPLSRTGAPANWETLELWNVN